MAADEEVMVAPPALRRGGLARWQVDPTIAISPSRVDAQRYASGRVVRWMQKAVRSPKSGELEFSGGVESELEYQTKATKRPDAK